jgi:2-methylcitrate dehydratase PrpD
MAKPEFQESATDNSPTRCLAEYIAAFSYKNIPPEVVSHIKFCFIDSLRNWAKEKARSSGAMVPRFPVPAPRSPTAR